MRLASLLAVVLVGAVGFAAAAPLDVDLDLSAQEDSLPSRSSSSPNDDADSAIATIPLALKATSPFVLPSGLLDLAKIEAHGKYVAAKYRQSAKNYHRNTGKTHKFAKRESAGGIRLALREWWEAAIGKRATGYVPLARTNFSFWYGRIYYGTPRQPLIANFDTGSADTITDPGVYRWKKSSTSKRTSRTFFTGFVDGTNAAGRVYTDKIRVAPGLVLNKTPIGVSSYDFNNYGPNALSGMAFPELSSFGTNYLPWVFGMRAAKKLSSNQFSFSLRENGSNLIVGGYDTAGGAPSFLPLQSDSEWSVTGTINGVRTTHIMDTGTTFILAPKAIAKNIFDATPGITAIETNGILYGRYRCNDPPTLTFSYGDRAYTLKNPGLSYGVFSDGSCAVTILGQDTGYSAIIVGDAFWLSGAIVTFDMDRRAVGFS